MKGPGRLRAKSAAELLEEHEEARRAGSIARAVQIAALNPEGGWWRENQRRAGKKVLLEQAVMDAVSVGCTTQEIIAASGASSDCVHRAIRNGRFSPASGAAECASLPSNQRVPLSVRLADADKRLLKEVCAHDGMEPSVAARQILELMCQRFREGDGYIEVAMKIKQALKPAARKPERTP